MKGLWPPSTPTGRLVVTTRRREAALVRRDRPLVEVGVFTEDEALGYLTAKRALTTTEEVAQWRALAADLGRLPLALAQAAAFITDKPLLTVAGYRDRLADRRKTLAQVVPGPGELPDEHRATVAATWSASIEHADGIPPVGLARPLLELASLLDPAGVPVAVFTADAILDHLAARLEDRVAVDDVHDALGNLHRLSLVALDPSRSARVVRVHALVQRAVRDSLTSDHLARLARTAADTLLAVWPDEDTDAGLGLALRSAAITLHTRTTPALWNPGGHPLLLRAGQSLDDTGMLTEALAHYEVLRDEARDHLGPDHPDTLSTGRALAVAKMRSGCTAESLTDLERLVADYRRILGADHPETLSTRNDLARGRITARDFAGAVAEFRLVVGDSREALGADHATTLAYRPNLVGALLAAGERSSVTGELELLEADCERALAPEDPEGMVIRGRIADWWGVVCGAAGAVVAHERLVDSRTRFPGPDHPDTLAARDTLATWRAESGNAERAVIEYERLLDDRTRLLGPDHLDTILNWNDLAILRTRTGDAAGGVTEFERLLDHCLRTLGPDHPQTLTARDNLAHCRAEAGDVTGAVTELEQLVQDRVRLLGPDHPETRSAQRALAHRRGDPSDRFEHIRRARAQRLADFRRDRA
ncbi:tetratricopeptide repeat protein [Saccharothrix sp. 6-C]|uniref:tetratricopeptide repeat protein n=1 Tax=Saccharothrix sp. 6-C TaxID=2781735 RepID=UPI00191740E0|nr:tetratricopeptide repeat protein [Saccharothrix sp. 6-C]QQQ80200.1 tetratricopeptide repeat protein [Saccharothrix sp. 6-C]